MKLVILESYALREGDLDWSGLAALADEVDYYPRTPYDQIAARIGDAELVIVNKCCIDGPVLDACPNLRWVGVTATGTETRHGVAAVDKARFPYGTVFRVPGYGYARAEDAGGAIKGNHIDLWFPSHRAALDWGRRTLNVQVWPARGR